MLCKFYLYKNGEATEISSSCIKNWDEIRWTLERKDFSGVTRSFTSDFQFVGEACEYLLSEYLNTGVFTRIDIAVFTIDNNWNYTKQFDCRLDFSTVSYDGYTFSISSVDSSLAAIIKANKSTKYEFAVGSEIATSKSLQYDRMMVKENVSFEFTGTPIENSSAQIYDYNSDSNGFMSVNYLKDEISVGTFIDYQDEVAEDGSYCIIAIDDVDVDIDYSVCTSSGYGIQNTSWLFELKKRTSSGDVFVTTMHSNGVVNDSNYLGLYTSEDDMKANCPQPTNSLNYAIVGPGKDTGTVWGTGYNGRFYYLYNSEKTFEEFMQKSSSGKVSVSLDKGDKLYISMKSIGGSAKIKIISSNITFAWKSRGKTIDIDTIKPSDLIFKLINNMCDGKLRVNVHLSDFDSRLTDTYLLAAESIRGISGAKVYSSFNNFCDWIEAVFGYTYYIGSRKPSKFKSTHSFSNSTYYGSSNFVTTGYYGGTVKESEIVYNSSFKKFFYYGSGNGQYFASWKGSDQYNDASTGLPREDTVFYNEKDEKHIYFINGVMHDFEFDIDSLTKDVQDIYFVHRSEIFTDNIIKTIKNIDDLSYSVDASVIYSEINAGYDNQDYDSINGRDEWNFTNHYTTGVDVVDKKLELISKFRADCYGIEFTSQKRGEDTTDSDSDEHVFFVYCKVEHGTGNLLLNRSSTIDNALSGSVFNGEFSPMACIKANASYINAIAKSLTLKYASSDGNADIVVDGIKMSDNIDVNESFFTAGTLKFKTDDMDVPDDWNGLLQVENNGTIYTGYISEAELKYGKQAGCEYTLIVKSIEQ